MEATSVAACLLQRAIAVRVTPAEVDHSEVPEHSPNHLVLSCASTHIASSCDPPGCSDLACEIYTAGPTLTHRYTSDDLSFLAIVSSAPESMFSCHRFEESIALPLSGVDCSLLRADLDHGCNLLRTIAMIWSIVSPFSPVIVPPG